MTKPEERHPGDPQRGAWDASLRQRVDELAAAVIDSRITPAEQDELAALLAAHVEARDAYLEQLDVEAMLRAREYRVGQASFSHGFGSSSGSSATGAGSGSSGGAPSGEPAIFRFPTWKISAAAAVLLVAIVAGLGGYGLRGSSDSTAQTGKPSPESSETLATVVAAQDAQWAAGGPQPQLNDVVGLGRLSLVQGTVRLATPADVELTVTGPCTLEFLSPRAVKVHQGRLKARVSGESAIGFRVLTPTADVVDLGTEFGVFVEQDGSSEVHVFQGVVVARAVGADQVVPIYRNEAGRVAAEHRMAQDAQRMSVYRPATLVAVAARPDLFGERAPAAATGGANPKAPSDPLPRDARVIFLGDPYLDRETPLLLVEQAWADAGWSPAPRLINGFVPDWIHQYAQRLEHHVLRFRPTHAVVSFGPQYAWKLEDRIPPEKFASDLARLVELLAARGIEPILTTGYRFRQEDAQPQQMLDRYNEEIRRLAAEKNLRLADIDQRFRHSSEEPSSLIDVRGQVASFAADQLIAAAMLEAFGQRELAVPARLDLQMLPGVLTTWQFHLLPANREELTPTTAAALAPREDWGALTIPQEDRFTPRLAEPSHSSLCRERSAGYATHLTTGTHPVWQGVTTYDSPEARTAWLHVGGGVHQVWLNGTKVYDDRSTLPAGHGYHAGYESIEVKLTAGANRIIVEGSGSIFASITESKDPPRRPLRQ